MTTLQVTLVIIFASLLGAVAEERDWKLLLNKPVNDEWQQIVGVAISQKGTRKSETLAAKIAAIQELIRAEYGQLLPVFVPPSFGVNRLDPIPATTVTRTGLPLSKVPAIEVFTYIAALNDYDIVETKVGIVFRPKPAANKPE
ncbi:MAG: hypothetical protein AAGA96_10110 [Verrucomicrobiota bacterium]